MAMFFNGWLGYGTSVTAGVLAEPTDSNYVRRPFALGNLNSGNVTDAGSGTVGPAMAPWGVIGFTGMFDAQVGGNLLLWTSLPMPITVLINQTITSGAMVSHFLFPDLTEAPYNTHVWPAGASIARTHDGRILIAGVPLQAVNGQLTAQNQAFGPTVSMASLPTTQQTAGSGLLWNNGGVISVS